MNNDNATPISKYLASINRCHGILGSGMPPKTPLPGSVLRTINFDDETFLGNESMLHLPSPPFRRNDSSASSSFNTSGFTFDPSSELPPPRKRKALYDDDSEKLRKKSDDMERLLRQTQIDLIDARSTIATLEHQKSVMETQCKEKVFEAEHSEKLLGSKVKKMEEKVVALAEKNEKLEKMAADTSRSIADNVGTNTEMVHQLEDQLTKSQGELDALQRKYAQDMNEQEEKIRNLNIQLEDMERSAEKWVCEAQSTRDQFSVVQGQLEKCLCDLKISETKVVQLEALKAKYDDALATNVFTSDAVQKYENLYIDEQLKNRKLQQEIDRLQDSNKILSSTISSEMVLKEEISTLKRHVQQVEGQLKEKVACDEERVMLHRELNEWKSLGVKLNLRSNNPTSLGACLRQYQNEILELKHEISSLNLGVKNKDAMIEKLQSDVSRTEERLGTMKTLVDKLELEAKRLSKKLLLMTKDRDSLKGLKESYEIEFGAQCPKALQKRIQELEDIVFSYEALIKTDPAMFKQPCSDCEPRITRIKSLELEVKNYLAEVNHLKQSAADNQDQLSRLETLDNDLSYRVLSFGKNPSMMSVQEKLREVIAENERLKTELARLNDQTLAGGGDPTCSEAYKALDEKYKSLERRFAILSDAYDFETSQLQTAIEKLFGYHCSLNKDPHQIRLQSTHSNDPDDILIFQAGETNDWMLLETPILDHFRSEVETYLILGANIPGFLAVVTLKLNGGIPEPAAEETEEVASGSHNLPGGSQPSNVKSAAARKMPVATEEESEEEEGEEYPHEYSSDEQGQEEEQADEDSESEEDSQDWNSNRRRHYANEDDDDDDDDEPDDAGGGGDDQDQDDDDIIMLD